MEQATSQTRSHFARTNLGIATGIFAFALLVRLIYLGQIEDIPTFVHFVGDAETYDAWAHRIIGGDLWGSEVFYQAPAYPYFLALLHLPFGHDPQAIRVIQMLMGAGSCSIIFFAANILFGRRVGIASGIILSLYAPAIFFDGLIQKTGLGLFLMCGLLASLLLLQEKRDWRIAAVAGGVLGFLTLTRENALVFLLALPIWMLLRFRDEPPLRRVGTIAAFVLAMSLVLIPVGIRNLMVGDTFAITTSQLGTNFYIGNNAKATGVYAPLLPGRETPGFEGSDAARLAERSLGRRLQKGEVSRYWLGQGLNWIAEEPSSWLLLTLAKTALTWTRFEVADSEDIYVHAEWSHMLAGLLGVFHFGSLVTLAGVGVLFAWPRKRDAALLYWLATVFSASVILFYVFARYRFPLVPILTPLAGLACCEIVSRLRARDFEALAWPLVLGCVIALLAHREVLIEEKMKAGAFMNFGVIMLAEGNLSEADVFLSRAHALDPDYGDATFQLALLRLKQGRKPEAEAHLRRVLELQENDHRAHATLAVMLSRQGDPEGARIHRVRAAELDPSRPLVRK